LEGKVSQNFFGPGALFTQGLGRAWVIPSFRAKFRLGKGFETPGLNFGARGPQFGIRLGRFLGRELPSLVGKGTGRELNPLLWFGKKALVVGQKDLANLPRRGGLRPS